MKTTTLHTICIFCVPVLLSAGTLSAFADEQPGAKGNEKRYPAANQKSYSGVIASMDAKEKTVTVKGLLFNKTFNIADNCAVIAGDKKEAALSDLRPGQKVNVAYKDASGVLVANRIAQEKLRYTGSVQSVDAARHILRVSRGVFSRSFTIPGDCQVVLKDDKTGSLGDVKAGHAVTVIYETPNDSSVARQIEQTSAAFVGTLDAIDASARTVKAKRFVGDKKFNLADNCRIVVNGKQNASLSDLRLGQKLAFSYDEVDGVNVVTRIAPAEGSAEMARSEKAAEGARK